MAAADQRSPDLTPERQERFRVGIEAFVQLSFDDAVELTGEIGREHFGAVSRAARRSIEVVGEIGEEEAQLRFGRRQFRPVPVTGDVLGQQVTAQLGGKAGEITLDGVAGAEPLHYTIDPRGHVLRFDQPLGLQIIFQSLYCEIHGTVDRMADAVMIGLLLPIAMFRRERQLGH